MPSAPRLSEVTLRRGTTAVFERLSLELVEPRIGLIGDNGAGKSSLLRLLCGLDRPSAGRVTLGDRELHGQPPPPGVVGLMFQNPDEQIIFPTVEEELALGPSAAGASRAEARAAARAALQRRGLAAWAPRAVASLSHGQRQLLCWLALDLAAPRLRLLDEPYASLDLPGVAWLREELRRADAQIIVSSHLLEPLRDFERVLWIEAGRVRADGPGAEVCAAYAADVAERVAAGRAGPVVLGP